jgi:hypothetical protein
MRIMVWWQGDMVIGKCGFGEYSSNRTHNMRDWIWQRLGQVYSAEIVTVAMDPLRLVLYIMRNEEPPTDAMTVLFTGTKQEVYYDIEPYMEMLR